MAVVGTKNQRGMPPGGTLNFTVGFPGAYGSQGGSIPAYTPLYVFYDAAQSGADCHTPDPRLPSSTTFDRLTAMYGYFTTAGSTQSVTNPAPGFFSPAWTVKSGSTTVASSPAPNGWSLALGLSYSVTPNSPGSYQDSGGGTHPAVGTLYEDSSTASVSAPVTAKPGTYTFSVTQNVVASMTTAGANTTYVYYQASYSGVFDVCIDWKVRESSLSLASGQAGVFHIDLLPPSAAPSASQPSVSLGTAPTNGLPGPTFVLSSDRDSPQQDAAYIIANYRSGYGTFGFTFSQYNTIAIGVPGVTLPAGVTGLTYRIKVEDILYYGNPGFVGTADQIADDGPQYVTVTVGTVSGGTGGSGPQGLPGVGFDQDLYGRPAFARATGLIVTQDGGHSWLTRAIAGLPSGATDAGLWYDRRTNSPRVFFGDGAGALYVSAASGSGEGGDWAAPATIAGVSGKYPVWAPHPAHLGRIALAYLDGSGALKTALSCQGGDAATWSILGAVATGLDFTATGRPGLCWLGGVLVCVYGSGSRLLCKASSDGGATWGAAVTVASSGPYTAISCRANQRAGVVFLEASTLSGTTYTAQLWASGDLGVTWALSSGTPPAPPTTGTALGVIQASGRLLAGTVDYSDNAGAVWATD